MNKRFLRILPLAAAVLLATSCSKDSNNDNELVNNGQENVVKQEKTVTVTGTLNKKSGISKISCEDEKNLTFDGDETLKFSGDDGRIHGETTLNTTKGASVEFSVELSYPADADYDLSGKTVTATIGTEPTDVTGPYEDIKSAVKNVYEVSKPVTIKADGDDNFSFSGNIEMNVNVAFVKNEKSGTINVSVENGTPVSLPTGQICIVPVGKKVTADEKTKSSPLAGKIYTIEEPFEVPAGFVYLGTKVNGKKILWATTNLDAQNPWESGGYYAWGETATKNNYEWNTYKYATDADYNSFLYDYNYKLTKYCNNSEYGKDGFTDNMTELLPADDVANKKNSNWHIPTREEWQTLCENCTWEWKTDYEGHGVKGYLVKGNGAEIFLPAAGYYNRTSLTYANTNGYYCSSSLGVYSPELVLMLSLYETSISIGTSGYRRAYGLPIRPVMRID